MLDVSKTPYTNKDITFEEWGKMENKQSVYEYGFLPMVEYNGNKMSQTNAINHFFAKKLGYMGSNLEEEYQIHEIMCSNDDWILQVVGLAFADRTNKEAIAKKEKEINEQYLCWILPILEKKFVNRKGKYFVGDKLSLADINVSYLHFLLNSSIHNGAFNESIAKHAPKLMQFAGELRTNELKDHFVTGTFHKEAAI